MKYRMSNILVPLAALALSAAAGAGAQTLPSFTVGRNLQASGSIDLGKPVAEGGMDVTITSEDPEKVRFATDAAVPGTASIVLKCRAGMRESPEFWVHGLEGDGDVTYTVTAEALGTLKGQVRLTPSAVLVMGPFRGPHFRTTPRSAPSRIVLYTVRLDSALKYEEQQSLAGGQKLDLEVLMSDSSVGSIQPAEVSISGGAAMATTDFLPAGLGSTVISLAPPAGFSKPAEHSEVTAMVMAPGIALTPDLTIGENLQTQASVGLGEPAPAGGLKVRLVSDDPGKLILSHSDTEVGTGQLIVTIPEGKVSAPVWLQSLTKAGTVKYSASAEGYQQREETVRFAPSGVVVMYKSYGPPDEAELLRPHAGSVTGGVWASLGKGDRLPLCLWTVQLDPTTLRGADITVQPLRAGANLEVQLQLSNPNVGKVRSPIVIPAGKEHAGVEFIPTAVGKTTISVVTPPGFTTAANSTAITATVTE